MHATLLGPFIGLAVALAFLGGFALGRRAAPDKLRIDFLEAFDGSVYPTYDGQWGATRGSAPAVFAPTLREAVDDAWRESLHLPPQVHP